MPTRHPLTISLTPELAQFVASEVRSGPFGSASKVVLAGLRLLATERFYTPPISGDSDRPPKPADAGAVFEGSGNG